jgi:hypothetical protein
MTTASDAPPKFELSFVQLIAGCLAAVTAAAHASFFGVAGTLIGTAIGSILGTAGTAIYSHSMWRTQARLRHLRRRGENRPGPPPAIGHFHFRQRNWAMIGVAAAAAFLVGLTVVNGVEAAAGERLSALLTGQKQSGGPTTTIGALTGGATAQASPTPTTQPSSSSPPGVAGVAPTTPTPEPSSSTSPTPSASATPTPSPSAQATVSP